MAMTRVPRAAGLQDRRHHVPPARLLGPHRPDPAVDRRRQGQRHPAALLLPRPRRAQGHQEPARRRRLAADGPQGDRVPAREPGRGRRRRASLVLDGAGSVLVRTDGELVDLVRQGQGVLNIVPARRGRRRARRRASTSSRRRCRCRPRHAGRPGGAPTGGWRRLRPHRIERASRCPHEQVRFAHNSERQFAKLLDFYGIDWEYEPRTFVLERDRDGQPAAGLHPRLLPAGLRPLHRDHHAEPEARHQEEPQGPPAARAVPRGARSRSSTSATTCTCW